MKPFVLQASVSAAVVTKRKRDEVDDLADEVSEPESSCPEDLGDVDDLLSLHGSDEEPENDNINNIDNENEVILANRQCNLTVDAILARDYGGNSPRKTLPGVSTKLAEIVNTWMRVTPRREHIRELFKEVLLPENVESLLPVKINEVLYQRLPFKAKISDQCLRGINTYFSRGIAPLLPALDELMKIECCLGDRENPLQIKDGSLWLGSTPVNIKQIRVWIGNALKILAVGNSVVLTKRKSNLRPYLDAKFHNLLKTSNPVTCELLGPDLEQRIADGTRIAEVGRRLATTRWNQHQFRPFARQSQDWGRGGRFQGKRQKQSRDFRGRRGNRAFPATRGTGHRGQYRQRAGGDRRGFRGRGHHHF